MLQCRSEILSQIFPEGTRRAGSRFREYKLCRDSEENKAKRGRKRVCAATTAAESRERPLPTVVEIIIVY